MVYRFYLFVVSILKYGMSLVYGLKRIHLKDHLKSQKRKTNLKNYTLGEKKTHNYLSQCYTGILFCMKESLQTNLLPFNRLDHKLNPINYDNLSTAKKKQK